MGVFSAKQTTKKNLDIEAQAVTHSLITLPLHPILQIKGATAVVYPWGLQDLAKRARRFPQHDRGHLVEHWNRSHRSF